jgi:hypothetical protein
MAVSYSKCFPVDKTDRESNPAGCETLRTVQIYPGDHPAHVQWAPIFSRGVKPPEPGSDHTPSSAGLRMGKKYTSNSRLCLHRHAIGWHLHLLGGNARKKAKRFHSIFEARSQEGLQNYKPSITNNVLDNTGAQARDAISPGRMNFIARRIKFVGF